MAPLHFTALATRSSSDTPTKASFSPSAADVEAWAEGFNVGALVILILIVFCNIKRGVWLHKLILLEVCFASMYSRFPIIYTSTVGFGNMAWHLHLLLRSGIWLVSTKCVPNLEAGLMTSQVSECHGNSPFYFVSAP